ncbi:hypothetical protein PFISCL1PPCAC_9774, partial [Pristionchus fissidentatus]
EKGQEINGDTGACKDCAKGKYKDQQQAGECIACPAGLTTAGEKSTSKTACSLLYCPPNTFVNANPTVPFNPNNFNVNDFCTPCGKGTWQPDYNQNSCVSCPGSPDTNVALPDSCRMENECSTEVENSCPGGEKCVKRPGSNYLYCVDDHADENKSGGPLSWWQVVLIILGACVGVAAVIGVTVILILRCCPVPKKAQEDEEDDKESFSFERRTTGDNMGIVPDDDNPNRHSKPFGFDLPPVHLDPSLIYNKEVAVPVMQRQTSTIADDIPFDYHMHQPVPNAAVVRMRKRLSNASTFHSPRPFSADSISSVPSIGNRDSRVSRKLDFDIPSITMRSNSESSLGSFSIASDRSIQSFNRRSIRPDSSQIVSALVDALDEDRFRGDWDRESSIL